MCEFVSWIEYEGKEYFLVNSDLETKEGKKLLAAPVKDDLCGHGAILAYYPELKGKGIHKECEDFSNPANFPASIVKEIKAGNLSRIGICVDVLTPIAKKQYEKVEATALEQYEKVKATAWEQYKKVEATAWEQYKKVEATAWEQYKKVEATALEQYKKVKAPAFSELVKNPKNRIKAWR
jgi:hypothetical protein